MTEKIIYAPDKATPGKVAPATSKPGASAQEHATHSRSFAEVLAQAEAVQDLVELGTLQRRQGGLQGAVQGTLQGIAGLLLRVQARREQGGERPEGRGEPLKN